MSGQSYRIMIKYSLLSPRDLAPSVAYASDRLHYRSHSRFQNLNQGYDDGGSDDEVIETGYETDCHC